MRRSQLLASMALGLASAHADGTPAPATLIDGILSARTRCFTSRVSRGDLLRPDLTRCFLIPGAAGCDSGMERDAACFMAQRTQEFCTDPRAFCASVTPRGTTRTEVSLTGGAVTAITGRLTPADAESLFVSPRCESGPTRDVMQQLSREASHDNATGDRALAEMMRGGWGCRPGVPAATTDYGRTRLAVSYDCDAALTPVNCATGNVRSQDRDNPLISGVPTELATIPRTLAGMSDAFLSMNFSLKGARFAASSGRCRITFTDETIGDVLSGLPDFPAPAAGQDQAAYLASIADPATRDRARARLEGIRQSSDQAFSAGADLLNAGSTRFRLAARSAYSTERLALLGNSFGAAKEGLLEYLRSLNPPPPQAVLDRITSTNLPDYSAFFAPSPNSTQRAFMSRLEATCRTAGETAYGQHQMANASHPHPHAGADILVCPSALIDMDLSNPRQLVSWLLHELGHSVDPCNLSRTQTAVTSPADSPSRCSTPVAPEIPTDQRPAVDAFFGRVATAADCMRSRRTSACAPVVRGGPGQALQDYVQALSSCYPGRYGTCAAQLYQPTGPRRSCQVDFTAVNRGGICASARTALDAVRAAPPPTPSGPQDQTQEAFSDMLAAGALTRVLARPELTGSPPGAPAYSTYQVNERRAEILTTLADWCFSSDGSESHPAPSIRIGLYAGTPAIRDALECDPRGAPAAGMPLAGCQAAFVDPSTAAPAAPSCPGSTP